MLRRAGRDDAVLRHAVDADHGARCTWQLLLLPVCQSECVYVCVCVHNVNWYGIVGNGTKKSPNLACWMFISQDPDMLHRATL